MFYYIRNNTIRGFTKVDSYKGENKILVDGDALKIQIAGVAPHKSTSDKNTYWYFDTEGNIYRNLKSKNDLFKPTNGNLVTDLFVENNVMVILYSDGAVDACCLYLNELRSVLNLVEDGIMKVVYGIHYGANGSEYRSKIITITKDFNIRIIEFDVYEITRVTPNKVRINNIESCTVERVIDMFCINFFTRFANDKSYCMVVDIKGDIWTGEKLDSLTLKEMECKVKKTDIRKYPRSVVFLMDNGEVYQSKDMINVQNPSLELIKIPFSTKISDIVTGKLGHVADCVVALDELGNLVTAQMEKKGGKIDWQIKTSEIKDKDIKFPGGRNTSRFSTTKRALA